jgi:hypothetical protein
LGNWHAARGFRVQGSGFRIGMPQQNKSSILNPAP